MTEKPEEIKQVEKQYNTLFVLYIISLVFSGISLLAWIFATYILEKKIIKIAFVVRLCAWIMVVPSIIICVVQSRRFYTYFSQIPDLQCSDKTTNRNFLLLAETVYEKVVKNNVIMISLSFVGMGLEIIYCIVFLNCFNKESSDGGFLHSNPFNNPYGMRIVGTPPIQLAQPDQK